MADNSKRFTKLNIGNYYEWSYRMEMRLRQLGVWDIVNGSVEKPLGSPGSKAVKGWNAKADLAMGEMVGAVEDSQLVHTRVSREPAIVWKRLEEAHMSQGLGSIISTWTKFFQTKKTDEKSMQAHVGEIRQLADRLEGLGDGPSESLMVAVLLISLPKSYANLAISLDTHPQRGEFDFVIQRCMNEELRQKNMDVTNSNTSDVAFFVNAKHHRDKKDITCFRCQEKGHYRNECKKPKLEEKDSAKAEVAAPAYGLDVAW